MHNSYEDIRSRIAEEPKWFDEHSVPRYCDFHPNEAADIYADEVALMEIACQACGKRFLVCLSSNDYKIVLGRDTLKNKILHWTLSWGDPPNVWCCPAGPSMTSEEIRVCEYWYKDEHYEWVRDSSLEVYLTDSIYD